MGSAVHAADLSVVPAALPGAVAGHPDPDPRDRPDQSTCQDIDDPSGFHGQVVGWVKPTIVNRSIRWVAPTLRDTRARPGRFDNAGQHTTKPRQARATGDRPGPRPRHAGAD